MNQFWKIIATGFGAGYSPFAPGTMGALVGVMLISNTLFNNESVQFFASHNLQAILLLAFFFPLGVHATNQLEPEWGHDPQRVVVDEMIGFWLSILFVPTTWMAFLAGFIFFRIFDIWKPLGIRKMEKLKGGWGVMMDDVLAGIYANVVLQILIYFFPNIFF